MKASDKIQKDLDKLNVRVIAEIFLAIKKINKEDLSNRIDINQIDGFPSIDEDSSFSHIENLKVHLENRDSEDISEHAFEDFAIDDLIAILVAVENSI